VKKLLLPGVVVFSRCLLHAGMRRIVAGKRIPSDVRHLQRRSAPCVHIHREERTNRSGVAGDR